MQAGAYRQAWEVEGAGVEEVVACRLVLAWVWEVHMMVWEVHIEVHQVSRWSQAAPGEGGARGWDYLGVAVVEEGYIGSGVGPGGHRKNQLGEPQGLHSYLGPQGQGGPGVSRSCH